MMSADVRRAIEALRDKFTQEAYQIADRGEAIGIGWYAEELSTLLASLGAGEEEAEHRTARGYMTRPKLHVSFSHTKQTLMLYEGFNPNGVCVELTFDDALRLINDIREFLPPLADGPRQFDAWCDEHNRVGNPALEGCTGLGRPSCTATECMFGMMTINGEKGTYRLLASAAAPAVPQAPAPQDAKHYDAWHEDFGNVLWWLFPIVEPPYVGTPLDDDWPFEDAARAGGPLFWTRFVVPVLEGKPVAAVRPDPAAPPDLRCAELWANHNRCERPIGHSGKHLVASGFMWASAASPVSRPPQEPKT
jgi:hypothetical protein